MLMAKAAKIYLPDHRYAIHTIEVLALHDWVNGCFLSLRDSIAPRRSLHVLGAHWQTANFL